MPPQAQKSNAQRIFWMSLSLTFAVIYSYLSLRQAFAGDYIVQDDARQHVFWMQRFLDPDLFPNDLITDYFQSVAPTGYSWFYRVLVAGDFSPWWINKLLPMVLGVVSTVYGFRIAMELLPIPFTGFLASLLLNQTLWMKDDLVSATPRAFVYPLFLVFLFYLLRRSPLGCSISVALIGLFYPQYVLVAGGILILQLLVWHGDRWKEWRSRPFGQQNWSVSHWPIQLSGDRQDYWLYGIPFSIALITIVFYAFASSEFDPVITAAQARDLPEFYAGGRSAFFNPNPLEFFFLNNRSGLFTVGLLRPATLLLALGLPFILTVFAERFPRRSEVSPDVRLLPQTLVVGVGLFILAHLVLFRLHLPSRYTEHTFRIVFVFAAAIALTLILDAILQQWSDESLSNQRRNQGRFAMAGIAVLILVGTVLYPIWVVDFPVTKYKIGEVPELYDYLKQQPIDIRIASLSEEADNLPSFAQRSVWVAKEYGIPYHWGYYEPFRQRAIALIEAQYSPDLEQVQGFIQENAIDFWLLDDQAFKPSYLESAWFSQYDEATEAAAERLKATEKPMAIATLLEECTVLNPRQLTLLDAQCLLEAKPPTPPPEDPAETPEGEGESGESQPPAP
jgi:hypothetical protein